VDGVEGEDGAVFDAGGGEVDGEGGFPVVERFGVGEDLGNGPDGAGVELGVVEGLEMRVFRGAAFGVEAEAGAGVEVVSRR
jgi:hypothetical protein